MIETLLAEINNRFPNRSFLNIDEVADFLSCNRKVILNWIKRADQAKRPPRLIIGKEPRFPKKAFAEWLVAEQATKGFDRIYASSV